MDAPPTDTKTPELPQVVFRPSKKRRQFRQRAEDDDNKIDASSSSKATDSATTGTTIITTTQAPTTQAPTAQTTTLSAPPPAHDSDAVAGDKTSDDTEEGGGGLSVAEALRLRNARKSRLKGVEFRAESSSAAAGEQAGVGEHDTARQQQKDEIAEALELGVSRRFAPQAGLVGELVNKHMEEYIESELARRYAADKAAQDAAAAEAAAEAAAAAATGVGSGVGWSSSSSALGATKNAAPPLKEVFKDRPTRSGRLQEVDLGEEVRDRNAALTEQARRRLAGEASDDESAEGKPRLGKDGKPWRSRKRRASDDIKRDQLVEELMRENKLDVYDQPESSSAAALDEDAPADERIAANFRREFMEAMAQRRQMRRRAAPSAKKNKPNPDEVLKGPKLGGSRNARAAMRNILLSQQQEARKKR